MPPPFALKRLRLPVCWPALLVCCGWLTMNGASAGLPARIGYNRDVRPILSNTCFKCHGPDVKSNQSELRLDLPDVARAPHRDKTGRVSTPLVPGKPEASEVWRRITAADSTVVMPPPIALHHLSDRDKTVIRRWIEQGANYEPHWSYLAPVKMTPPAVRTTAAVRNPIDRFILQELEARSIRPSPEADRRTLIRRLSLDLTGLPPSVKDTEDFVSDPRPDAYEQLVERLLASPHYGERMAVGWLDLARFADSVGFHGDQASNNFPYRDYVITAFNHNKPFDQFTLEQLAGDLLPGATIEQRIASGFNRLNMVTREGGAQPKEYLAKYAADRVRTVSTTWLGSTMGCCECHDHKYDPFATQDFYQLAAYFSDIRQWGVYQNYYYTPEPELKAFTNNHPFPPEIEVESDYLKRRAERLHGQFSARVKAAVKTLLDKPASRAVVRQWVTTVAPRLLAEPQGWAVAVPETATGKGTVAVILPDHSVRFEGPPDKTRTKDPEQVVILRTTGPVATVRLEILPDEKQGGSVVRDENEFFTVKLSLAVQRSGETKPQSVAIADVYPENETETYFNGRLVTSMPSGWRSSWRLAKERQSAIYLLSQPLVLTEGDRLVATLATGDVARARVWVSPLGAHLAGESLAPEIRAAFQAAEPTQVQQEQLAAEYFRGTGAVAAPANAYADALRDLREIAECREGRTFTTVTVANEPRVTRVLPRGDWQSEAGKIVQPSPPHFLPGGRLAEGAPRQTRLDLARWLVSRENPLTARTFVNRLWKQFFGTGLSAVLDDLGAQGEWPSHPELLDWLAVEFMDRGWDVKAMVRLMVTSGTYRQSSRNRPELREADPDNRLLASQNPRRLDAEFIRDNALSVAGLLNPEMGGPSVSPYQPENYYAALNFPLRDYQTDIDERQYRRGVYMHWQRTFLHPMLANFDAPSREECTASRSLSSTPQQALTLLNDPTFVEAARVLAERLVQLPAMTEFKPRLDYAFRRVLARPPTEREQTSVQAFFAAQLAYYREHPEDARKVTSVGMWPPSRLDDRAELAAWASVSRVLLNLNETIVRY